MACAEHHCCGVLVQRTGDLHWSEMINVRVVLYGGASFPMDMITVGSRERRLVLPPFKLRPTGRILIRLSLAGTNPVILSECEKNWNPQQLTDLTLGFVPVDFCPTPLKNIRLVAAVVSLDGEEQVRAKMLFEATFVSEKLESKPSRKNPGLTETLGLRPHDFGESRIAAAEAPQNTTKCTFKQDNGSGLVKHRLQVQSVSTLFTPRQVENAVDAVVVSGSVDETVRVWRVATGECAASLHEHTSTVYSVCAMPHDADVVVSAAGDRTLRVWRVSTRQCMRTLTGHVASVFSVCPVGNDLVASGSGDRTVRVWQLGSGECVAQLEGHRQSVLCVCASAHQEDIIASSSKDSTVRVWQVSTRECLAILRGHTGPVLCVLSSPHDADVFVSGSGDRDCTVRVWRYSTRECVATMQGHFGSIYSVCMSASDLDLVISGCADGTVCVWRLSTCSCELIFQDGGGAVKSVFSPPHDGDTIVSGAADGRVRIWRLSTRECVATMAGHADEVLTVWSCVNTPLGPKRAVDS